MKLTRHNGRSGKNGTYNPRHNDRKFDIANSDHIDAEREKLNIYWDCYRGYLQDGERGWENELKEESSFSEIELQYYELHYGDYVKSQNARNEKSRHPERNRTVEDLWKNKMTCPEETIYQIGTVEESVSGETLRNIVEKFTNEMEARFGEHIHVLDWALHMDEGTPHIHERHVFDCENRYGELCPQQEKALEKMGIPLVNPEKPKGKNNNRKMMYDSICRTILFDICKKHGLYLDQTPEYGGREYLEKQEYILFKQKHQIEEKQEKLEELTLKIDDVEQLLDDVSEIAYDKACDVVTDTVREETQKADLKEIADYQKWVTAPERKTPDKFKKVINECLDVVQMKLKNASQNILKKMQGVLHTPEVKAVNKEKIKEKARESIHDRMARARVEADRKNKERWKAEGRDKPARKNNSQSL